MKMIGNVKVMSSVYPDGYVKNECVKMRTLNFNKWSNYIHKLVKKRNL